MDYLSQYIVPFYGLDNKSYQFDFVVEDRFFDYFENEIIKGGNIDIKLTLIKKTSTLHLKFNLSGFVKIICDRCLELYDQIIKFENSIVVEFGNETNFDTNKDIVMLDKNKSEINISQFIFEFINFAIPLKHFHPDTKDGNPGCNIEMLEILNKHLIKEDDVIDSRWEKLKEIKNKY